MGEFSLLAPDLHSAWVRRAAAAGAVAYAVITVVRLVLQPRPFPQAWTEMAAVAAFAAGWLTARRGRATVAARVVCVSVLVEFLASMLISPEFPVAIAMAFPVAIAGFGLLLGGTSALAAAVLMSVTAPAAVALGAWLQGLPNVVAADPFVFVVFAVSVVVMAILMRMGLGALAQAYWEASENQKRALQLGSIVEETQTEAYIVDIASGQVVTMSRGAREHLGYQPQDLAVLRLSDVSPSLRLAGGASASGVPTTIRAVHRRKDGSAYPVEVQLHTGELDGREVMFIFAVDVSARVRAEQEQRRLALGLQHAQKMEAIGQLAGGVAHDFNNVLMAIGGFAEMICEDGDEAVRGLANEILRAQARGSALTRQLLAFARKDVAQPRLLDLCAVVRDLRPLLTRLAGEQVALDIDARAAPAVLADRGQIEQILVNLVANARDAIAGSGRVKIGVVRASATDRAAAGGVTLTVEDDGSGMDDVTASRIFEPFFTTKSREKGTGLGLAMVHGIVSQNGGTIEVASACGRGTTMTIHWPPAPSDACPEADAPSAEPSTAVMRGGATILVAEDDDVARLLVQRLLERAGYRAICASGGEQAMQLAGAPARRIDLLLTDVVMPGISGFELATRFRALYPGVPVLYMSGFIDERAMAPRGIDADRDVIHKPFSGEQLRGRIAAVLQVGPARGW